MKRKKNGLWIILLLIVCDAGLDAQHLYIRETGGTQSAYLLDDIRKISFQPRILEVNKTDGAAEAYSLGVIRYLNFLDLSTYDEPDELEKKHGLDFHIFPNPVKDIVTIRSFSAGNGNHRVSILNTNGNTVFRKDIMNSGDMQADLSFLASGIYFCRIISGEKVTVVKLVKN